jgi:hypothetical protein
MSGLTTWDGLGTEDDLQGVDEEGTPLQMPYSS